MSSSIKGRRSAIANAYSISMEMLCSKTPSPSKAQVQSLLDKLLPSNAELDPFSALLIIERSGADSVYFSEQPKLRLERKVDDMRSDGRDVPP